MKFKGLIFNVWLGFSYVFWFVLGIIVIANLISSGNSDPNTEWGLLG